MAQEAARRSAADQAVFNRAQRRDLRTCSAGETSRRTGNRAGVAGQRLATRKPRVCGRCTVGIPILTANDLRNWGEFGRRLAMGNVETVRVRFFGSGCGRPGECSRKFEVGIFSRYCRRQLVLSSSIALETFESVSALAREVADDWLLLPRTA